MTPHPTCSHQVPTAADVAAEVVQAFEMTSLDFADMREVASAAMAATPSDAIPYPLEQMPFQKMPFPPFHPIL